MDVSRTVLIIGGSVAGLMAGVVLTQLGYDVEILEQNESNIREEAGAGITAGPFAQEFFSKYDQNKDPYAVACPGVNYLDANSKVQKFARRPMLMTTWSILYYRLRANFDGYKSPFCPEPPVSAQNRGKGIMRIGAKVTGVSYTDGEVNVAYTDVLSGKNCFSKSNLVIAADGASSTVRQLLLPDAKRSYSGYLGWRGIISEGAISEETRTTLDLNFNAFGYPGGYIVCYTVPDKDGSLRVGSRRINWVWYAQCQDSTKFADIMTDSTGWRHRNSIPKGKMADKVWKAQKEYGNQVLNSAFNEILNATQDPFLSVIQDFSAPKASFFDGKLLMIGDALAVFRPHLALSLNQAGLDVLLLEKLMKHEINTASWEKQVVQYGQRTKLMSAAFGSWYMYGGLRFFKALCAYIVGFLPFPSVVLAIQGLFR